MDKIKLITDTTSDLPEAYATEHSIDVLSIPIAIDGQGYYERESFTREEFFQLLEQADEIPKTSRIAESEYIASYERAFHESYTHVFVVTINAGGSGTNASAQQALARFYEKNQDAKDKIAIEVIDSKSYSAGYGRALELAATSIKNGATALEIHDFFQDWFQSVEIFLGCYTLEYAKKSGRINAAVAFVGEMLGMRPVIHMVDGKTEVVAKVRGDARLVETVFGQFKEIKGNRSDIDVTVVYGRNKEQGEQLKKLIEKDLGRKVPFYPLGAVIAINSGPDVCAFVVKGEKRC